MLSFLVEFVKKDDGAYLLGKGGYFAFAAFILLLVIAAAVITTRKDKNNDLRTVRLTVSAISLALAFITSFIKFELPFGGSITLFSMFFICFIGYLYGPATGLTAAFAYSFLQFIQSGGTYFLSIPQVLFDYILAFTALGIAGFWYRRKHGLVIGYIAGCIARGVFASIAGYLYWMDYMPESFPKAIAFLYPIVYNYFYILAEMIITLIILAIPAVRRAIRRISYEATQNTRG